MDELLTAIQQNNLNKVKELLTNDPAMIEGRHLFEAARVGDLALIRYLVEYSRISLNEVDAHNRTALHYCALSDRVDSFDYLVKKCGLDPLAGDGERITPWELAIREKKNNICNYMTEHFGRYEDYYKNPVRTGFYPDPSIVRVGEDYYMVNSSFIYFPCIPVSHSTDLVHWEIIGHAITEPSWAMIDDKEGGRGYWAPDISFHNGRFYITATLRYNDVPPTYRRQIIVSSERPEGPYSKPVLIDEDGIDPSLFHDEDGKSYMLLNRGARILELNRELTKQTSEARLLYYGDMKRAPEGPHLYKKDGYYYLLLAEGGTGLGHRVTVARSKELFGDYEPSPCNPILIQRDERAAMQRCGHGDLVDTPDGRWYMVYLCGRLLDGKWSMLGRETALDPVEWTADGWPVVNRLKGPSVLQRKPFPESGGTMQIQAEANAEPHRKVQTYDRDQIAESMEKLCESPAGLPFEFMTPRTFRPEELRCLRREVLLPNTTLSASFAIRGSRAPLSSVDSRNIVLRRQTSFSFAAGAALPLSEAMEDGQEKGLTGYYDENTYFLFGICQRNGESYLYVREHIGDEDNEFTDELPLSVRNKEQKEYLMLRMETDGLKRSLSYAFSDEIHGGEAERNSKENSNCYLLYHTLNNVYYLCDEGLKRGKRFTGAMVGLYVYEGSNAKEPYIGVMEDFWYADEAQGEYRYLP